MFAPQGLSGVPPFAVLKDSLNVEFRVPLEKISFNGRSYPNIFCENFEEYFVLTEQVDSIIQYKTNLRLQKEAEDKERMRLLINKYGKTYADFLFMKSDKTIERFNLLAQKYGKVNAKLMIEGEVRLGWSKDMCRESWGEPDDINTTTASWGVHEQWVYELSYNNSFKMCFLYFKNGVLTTIQN